jgi:lanosterol synthase
MPKWDQYYRHLSKGGWSFSTRDCGWIVADCTAEGLKATLLLQKEMNCPMKLSDDRLYDSVDLIISLQNQDGGYATYELQRGSVYLEWLNPSEVFGK